MTIFTTRYTAKRSLNESPVWEGGYRMKKRFMPRPVYTPPAPPLGLLRRSRRANRTSQAVTGHWRRQVDDLLEQGKQAEEALVGARDHVRALAVQHEAQWQASNERRVLCHSSCPPPLPPSRYWSRFGTQPDILSSSFESSTISFDRYEEEC